TGLSENRVLESLEKLLALGAIRFEPPPTSSTSQSLRRVSTASFKTPVDGSSTASRPETENRVDMPGPSPDSGLDEVVDLEPERKRRILELFSGLDSLTHYQLLGVVETSDKAQIKTAYFNCVSAYHPDRYYGKKLGSYKSKLEKIFSRMTEAHDTLTRGPNRAEYDKYLDTRRRTSAFDQLLSDTQASAAEVLRIEEQIRKRASEPPTPSTGSVPPPPRRSSGAMRLEPLDPAELRRALARKLGGSRPGRSSPHATPAVDPAAIQQKVAEDLKARYEHRMKSARQQQLDRFLKTADQALAEKRPMSAVNALRIAVSLSPGDATLVERLEQVQKVAYAEMSAQFAEQAAYEERAGRWSEAARSYERASLGNPQPNFLERAAHCLLEAGGEVRQAVEHAKKAVSMLPNLAHSRLTLARAYLAAGLRTSALGELERAAALAPGDARIQDWLKRVKSGEI
ncbi:MAG TPA: DnaJ domain-containing protein, partial [Polyangiaceae bacterium]